MSNHDHDYYHDDCSLCQMEKESATGCNNCRHIDDNGFCMRLGSYDMGCSGDVNIKPPDGFSCSEFKKKLTE